MRSGKVDRTENGTIPRDKSNDFRWILFPDIEDKRIVILGAYGTMGKPLIEISVEVLNLEKLEDEGEDQCKKEWEEQREAFLKEVRDAIPFRCQHRQRPNHRGPVRIAPPETASGTASDLDQSRRDRKRRILCLWGAFLQPHKAWRISLLH
jgi:hypothetical protein